MIANHASEWSHNSRARFRMVILLSLLLPPVTLATEPAGISPRDNALVTRGRQLKRASPPRTHGNTDCASRLAPDVDQTDHETGDGAVAPLLLVR
jgi:hypothetical protein